MVHRVLDLPTPAKRDLLERLVFHGIVFNMSWEDPEMDRRAFGIQPHHNVISISSAGCNPLNFLCQSPRRLISIDGNPAQNALLELKLAAIETLPHEQFFDIFAARRPQIVTQVYRTHLRPNVSSRTQQYWDKHLWMVARGVYDFGRMGLFCRILRRFIGVLGMSPRRIDEFFELRTLAEQREWYDRYVAPRLWGAGTRSFVNFRPLLYLAGVHPAQYDLIDDRHDMYHFVKERIEYALTRVPIYDNYFLSMAVTGRFRGRRVPPYLLEENYDTLRRNLDRVLVVNGWLGPFLDSQPAGSIDRFNLLDIFDWMPPAVFEQTLHSVLRAASRDATMIYRSGSYRLDPPPSVLQHLVPHAELARELLATDRSATYGSFYVFTIKSHNGAATVGARATGALTPA